MQELIAIGLTLPLVWVILKLMRKKARKKFSKTLYRQSDIHRLLKYFFSIRLPNNEGPSSQLTKRKEKSMIKVIFVDNQAYWVSENTFFVAEWVHKENFTLVPPSQSGSFFSCKAGDALGTVAEKLDQLHLK